MSCLHFSKHRRARHLRRGGLWIPRGACAVSKESRRERAVNRAARERLAGELARDLSEVFASFREGINLEDAQAAFLGGDARIIVNAGAPNDLETQLAAVIGENLEHALESGAEIGLRFGPASLGSVPISVATEAALHRIRTQAASTAFGVTEVTAQAIREILTRGITDQLSPVEVARRVGQLAGLTPSQFNAVENYRRAITERLVPVPSALTPKVRRVIDQEVDRYRDRQLLLRGRNIAETETQEAIMAGERAFWDQAVSEQAVVAEMLVKTWRTVLDLRVCPICEPLHGQVVAFNESFQTAVGPKDGPTAHPRCRCYLEYAEVDDQGSPRRDRGEGAVRDARGRRLGDPEALREDLAIALNRRERLDMRLSQVRPGTKFQGRLEAALDSSDATIRSIERRLERLSAQG